jgi:hypothetical protein
MNREQVKNYLDTAFRVCLLALFLVTSGIFFFVFVINWEAFFFGVRLAGPMAGMVLGIKSLVPAILAFILIRHPQTLMKVAFVSVAFFGFFFLDSSVTIQMNTRGRVMFGIVPLVGVLIPAIVVIGHFLGDGYGCREDGC